MTETKTLGRREALREAVVPLSREDVIALSERLNEPDWLREKRIVAWQRAESMLMPTLNDEAWRRTDIRTFHWQDSVRIANGSTASLADVPRELYAPLIGEEQGGLLVFSEGRLVHSEFSDTLKQQGVIFADLSTAAREHPALVQKWLGSKAITGEEDKIAALSAAFWTHGVILYVPRNVIVELPLHSIEYAPASDTTGTHILVVLEEGASATYLHESASPTLEKTQTLHLITTELIVGDAANLRYVALQNWGEHTFNFGHQRGRIGRDAQLDWVVGEMGTRMSKIVQTLDLDGNGSFGRMSGIYFTHGRQHLDLDTQQNHHAVGTTSDLLFKGTLRGHSRTVWQGMIVVDKGAQKTDGFQANRNLLLDNNARADSIPGLEIKADDVRCTHAATVGKVDENEIFYLESRGIPRQEAVKLIVHGFFDPVMQRIPFEEVRDRLSQTIEQKLS
jgi:Fe-S cluster assembly protein SufD